ncbi:FAD-binding oxidoreductase [Paenibacillus sp. 1781tsa1]|uniref:NAD(P)/FAD-dependent oxidoreductase n=1 Tax=Paenibacillus sp. 1781tsa1 TaxID=2953810 RepID=UPI00209CA39E|nr:FAD-dependent oxidoreductase [Paenibacillus sp. 1781tsa1]MCP1183141.1 FAD-binding oxidoreductase [Paenibacillus sp. 1781tsa1]
MELINGKTFWPTTFTSHPHYPVLQENLSCDCLIIGGGMGGALSAKLLTDQGIDTVVIDKRDIGYGSSMANTGLLQYTNDKTLTSCIQTFGEERGVRFYELCRDAMHHLEKISSKLEIDPWFVPRTSLYCASHEEDVSLLEEEYRNLKHYGFDVELWDQEKISALFPFSKRAALYTSGDAEVNPYRLVHSLFHSASRQGARVYAHSEFTHCDYDENGVLCYTPHGTVRAKHVIFSTGYETQEIKKDRGAYLQSTYAIATKPLQDLSSWYKQCMIWETERPYLYMRTTPDGRIIAGGLDENRPREEQRAIKAVHKGEILLQKIAEYFPLPDLEVDYAWEAVFGSTHDGLPLIGPHPDYPNSYFVEGYGGNGTVYSMIAASLIVDAITGKQNPDMDLFSLTRTSKPSPV